MPAEPLASFAALRNRLMVTGTLVSQTALRIGAGRDSNVISNDLPVLRDSRGTPFIPGASLKGAFRARIEALVRAIAPDQASDIQQIEDRMRQEAVDWDDAQVWSKSTMIDLTFGAPWLAGRIFFKDARVDPTLWFGQFEIRNGVALNRDTETVDQGKLYDYEVVPAGTSFDFALAMENAEPWQLGMITVALQPWVRGEVQMGGFRSRGLGYVQLQDMALRYVELHSVDDLLALLDSSGGHTVDEETLGVWRDAFVARLKQAAAAKEHGHA